MKQNNEIFLREVIPGVMPLKGPALDSEPYPMLKASDVEVTSIGFASDAEGTPQYGVIKVCGTVPGKGEVTFYFPSPNLPESEE